MDSRVLRHSALSFNINPRFAKFLLSDLKSKSPNSLISDRFTVLLWVNVIAFLIVSGLFIPKGMFSGGESDGFYAQMFHVIGEDSRSSPLYWVHMARFWAVSPFFAAHVHNILPLLEAVLMVFFLLPVLTVKFGEKRPYFQVLFVYLPLLFSFRSVLVMCAIAYLFICLYGSERSYIRLGFSALLANLSSGVVLPWLIIAMLCRKRLARFYRFFNLIVLVAIVLLAFSVVQKFDFFFGSASQGGSLIERNTFSVSLANQQYLRLGLYTSLLLAWFLIVLNCFFSRQFRSTFSVFFLPIVVTPLLEGLGFVSFLIPICWYFMGVTNQIIRSDQQRWQISRIQPE